MKLALLPFILLTVVTTVSAAENKPNVLLIFTDDHAQWAVGAYGNKDIHTPNIDRLAREGMLFTQGFTKPVCSPSRAMLLTGQYSHRLGIPDYIPYGNPVHSGNGLPAGTSTVASTLKSAGYQTRMVGKWHLGYGEEYYPKRYGFDKAEGYRYIAPGKHYKNVGKIPYLVNEKSIEKFKNNPRFTDILTDRVIQQIRSIAAKKKTASASAPFFFYFPLYRPHLPWNHVPEEDAAHYKNKNVAIPDLSQFPEAKATNEQVRELTRQYYANVTCADRNIGRVLDSLDETGLADNTIVIFIGDNGFMVGQSGLLGKGNARQLEVNDSGRILRNSTRANMFNDSVLVPFIIRWPGVVKPNSTNKALVSTMDILPTLAEIAAVKTPIKTDGRSLVPILKSETQAKWRDAYFDTYDMIYLGDDGVKPHMRMVRKGDWKLVLYNDENGKPLDSGQAHELFNLAIDPKEKNNLYDKPQSTAIQGELETRLRAWMRESGVSKSKLKMLVNRPLGRKNATLSSEEKQQGFKLLVDGVSFAGWKHDGNWQIKNGAFYRASKGGSLTFIERLVPDDFELRFEWKVSKGCNSGIYYRPAQYEYQVLDNANSPYGENPRQAAASLFFCMAPSKDASKPFGKWNQGRIVGKGTVIQHWLNGEKVIDFDYTDPKWVKEIELLSIRGADLAARGGKLSLQDHGQAVWFRKLRMREIPQDEIIIADPNFQPMPVPPAALKKEQDRVRSMLKKAKVKK